MKTKYSVSPWIVGLPAGRRKTYPTLRGEHTADLLIVGGGLTGCVTAYLCAAARLDVLLVEADRIGHGSTGRGAGLLLPEPVSFFKDVVSNHGLRSARRVFESWSVASRDGAALVRRLGITCGLESVNALTVPVTGDDRLRREHDARVAAGIDAAWLSPTQVRQATGRDASGALRVSGGSALDPYRTCLGMAAAAARRGASIFERSVVTKVRTGRTGVEAQTRSGVVRAPRVVVATGTATEIFPALRRHFTRQDEYAVLTEGLPPDVRKAFGSSPVTVRDTHAPPHRLRLVDTRMLIAGADQKEVSARSRNAALVQRTGQLMYELLTMHPGIAGLKAEYGWERTYGRTADGLMYIGPHRHYPQHLFALGDSSASMTGAFLAARILTRAALERAEKGDDVFGWGR